MHIFSKHCYCRSRVIPFRSAERFDEHSVARVFCPECSDRSPAEALMVAIVGVPGWSGLYGIDWNQSCLEERDPKFKDTELYYKKLFSSGAVTFGFLPRTPADRAATVIGIKEHLPSTIFPAGRTGQLLAEEATGEHRHRHPPRGSRGRKHRPRGWGRQG